MAKLYSNKSCYPSRYGGGNVTIYQYITEYLCEKVALKNKKELPQKFWELEEWNKFFKTQIVLLNKCFKNIHPRAIVKALKDNRSFGITSFGGFLKVPKWESLLKEKNKECVDEDSKKESLKETKVTDATKIKPIRIKGSVSLLNKLSELDNNG